ncbi:cysteine synthase A [Halorussus limi]|uniref:cysteine synthase n=1 Tax=Halorussus limi TaxID=2938695 RepID=A0A8U0HT34_9EURY|nr:cysteine synthase A [Halorussus limi]UPV74029.1 cysteine synthase A [Halorussus limi]
MAESSESTATFDAAESIDDLIGGTPLLRLDAFAADLFGKVEASNPYSVKDRIAREMVDAAEESGELGPDGVVVESTSGNTGIGLAAVCAARDYDLVLTMPESMSEERRKLLRALDAELELTPAEEGMGGANRRAAELADGREGAVLARQFENDANPRAHRRTTGPELWRATDGEVDAFVAGVGTGGTITGVSEYAKEERGAEEFTAVAVEPAASPTLSEQCSDGHDLQGIGPGFVPDVLRTELVDEVRAVAGDDAKAAARKLARTEGLAVGVSAGAAVAAAAEYARNHPGETVVAMLPDAGERYLSTDLYE